MQELNQKDAIMHFVSTFRVARVRQIKRFFKDRRDCDVTLDTLVNVTNLLHCHGEDILSPAYPGKLPSPLSSYTGTLKCLDMLTGILKSGDVQWLSSADFPLNIMFLTTDDQLYDVSYVDSTNWVQKYALFVPAWKKGVPPGEADPYNHIAVVPSLDVAQKLRELPFTQFVVVDCNGGVLGIYDNVS